MSTLQNKIRKSQRRSPNTNQDSFSSDLLVISKLLLEAQDLSVVFNSFVTQIARFLNFDRVSIARLDENSNSFVTTHIYGAHVEAWSVGSYDEFSDSLFDDAISIRESVQYDEPDLGRASRDGDSSKAGLPAGFNSTIAAPLLVRSNVLGLIALRSARRNAYSEQDLVKIEQIADLLASAMQHYKTQSDLEKQLLEKTVIVDLARDLSGATELSELLPAIVDTAEGLFDFDYVRLRVIDPSRGEIVSEYSHIDGVLTDHITDPIPWSGTTAVMMAERSSGFIFTEEQINKPGGGWASLNIGSYDNGYASLLAVPLLHRGGAVGTIVFWAKEADKFTERHIALVEQLGAQVSGAVATAVEHGELRRSISERIALNEIYKVATRSSSVREFFEAISEQLSTLLSFDRLEVFSVNEQKDTDELVFARGLPVQGMLEGVSLSHQLRGSFTPEWTDRFNTIFGITSEMPTYSAHEYERVGLESWLCIPVHMSQKLYGHMFLHSREPEAFGQMSGELLERVFSHVNPTLEHIFDTARSKRQSRHHMALAEIGTEIFATGSSVKRCELVADYLGDLMTSDLLEITLPETAQRKTSTLRKLANRVDESDLPRQFDLYSDGTSTAESRLSIRITDTGNPEQNKSAPEDLVSALIEAGFGSAAAVPITVDGGTSGHILVSCAAPEMFSKDDLRNLEQIARYLSSASQQVVKDQSEKRKTSATSMATFDGRDLAGLKNIELIVIDSQPICRGGYTALFEPTPFKFVGAVENSNDAVQLASMKSASVIVMELHGEDLVDVRHLIEDARVPVLLISDTANKTLVSDAIAAGAAGFVLKGISVGKLAEAIETIADGGSIFDPGLLGGFLSSLRPHDISSDEGNEAVLNSLSDSELSLLTLVANGKSNKEISVDQGFTVGTIKNQVARLFKKLDASSRVDAAKIAYRLGIVR